MVSLFLLFDTLLIIWKHKLGSFTICRIEKIVFTAEFLTVVTPLKKTTRLKDCVNYGWKSLTVSHHLAMFNGQKPCGSRDKTYLICHLTACGMSLLYAWKHVIVAHHLAKFDGHRPCGRRNMYLICHVPLQDHVIKGSCDFMEGHSSLYVITLPNLVAIVAVVVEIQHNLICHVTLKNHVIKGFFELMEGSSSLYVTTLPSSVTVWYWR